MGDLLLQGLYFHCRFVLLSLLGGPPDPVPSPHSPARSRGHGVESLSATSVRSSQQIPTASMATKYQDRLPFVSLRFVNTTCVSHHPPHQKRSPAPEDPISAGVVAGFRDEPLGHSIGCCPTHRWDRRGGNGRVVTWSLRWHSARFCSSQEQLPRMNLSQVAEPLCPASTPNFSVPSSSATCRGQDEKHLGHPTPRDGYRTETDTRTVCSAGCQTRNGKAGWCV